jgi:quercetin dioxygenase-like cupin family protein
MTFVAWHSRGGQAPLLIPAIGLELTVRSPPQASGQGLTVIDAAHAPGFGPPLHRHSEAEIFRILSGRYLFEVDGRRFFGEIGDVIAVPSGMPHAFINAANEIARQTITFLPAFDAATFFTKLGALMRDGLPNSDVLNAFGRTWDVEFLGPPLSRQAVA